MTKNEINFAANYIAKLALESNGAEKVNLAIESLLSTYEKEASIPTPKNSDFQQVTSTIFFTQKEIQKMDKDFKNIIIANGLVAKVSPEKAASIKLRMKFVFVHTVTTSLVQQKPLNN